MKMKYKMIAMWVCIILSLTACANHSGEKGEIANNNQITGSTEDGTVYSEELQVSYQTVYMEEKLLEMECLATENAIYISGIRQGAEGFSAETVIYRWEEATDELMECMVLEQEKKLCWCSNENGNVALIGVKIASDSQKKEYFLHVLDEQGAQMRELELQNTFNEGDLGTVSEIAMKENMICIASQTVRKVFVLDLEENEVQQSYDVEMLPECIERAGDVFLAISGNGQVYEMNPASGSMKEWPINALSEQERLFDCAVDGENLFVACTNGIYLVTENSESDIYIEYQKYNILPGDYMCVQGSGKEDEWKIVSWGQSGELVEIYSLKPMPAGTEKVQKEIVTLSVYNPDSAIQEAVIAFNKMSEKYRVEIISAQQGTTAGEFWEREQIEFTTGKGADIFTKTSHLAFADYVKKGIAEDLTPYIERDLNPEDYVESALYAYERNGGVYAIGANFVINLMVTDKGLIGDAEGWSFSEMAEIMRKNSKDMIFSPGTDASEIMRLCIGFGGIKADDYETIRECILFAEQYGTKETFDEDIQLGENVLVTEVQLNDALDWADAQCLYGENIAPIGYPRDNREGIRYTSTGWSINANSDNKEGAWEFLKFLLSEKYQRQMKDGFSPLKEVFEEQLETYLLPQSYDLYLPEAGGIITVTNRYTLPSTGAQIEAMTEEQIDTVRHLVEKSNSFVFDSDYDAWVIIFEEASAYFAGQYDIDAAMKNIESRVNLYLEEKR